MALKLSMGQYYPADSPIHSMDPRAKLGCALAGMLATFVINTPLQLGLALGLTAVVISLAHVGLGRTLASIRPALFALLLLSVCNLLLTTTGEVLWQMGPLSITQGGLWAACLYSLRVICAIALAALLLLTTTPTELTDAFDAALAPLARLGLPAHELAMVFSLMLRFIPTLADEAQAIVDAQTSRGAGFGKGSLSDRLHAIDSVIVALLASSAHHANGLSRALDARHYVGGANRSHWHPLKMHARDWIAVVLALGAIALVCCIAPLDPSGLAAL